MEPGLYLVGTPIGNLEDITLRALRVLREADVIMAEDTRHSRILLNRHEITTHMISCHKFNEASRIERVRERIDAGQAVALITDGGMPCISDPGARLVSACREAGHYVTVIPGPSAVSAAIALSGLVEKAYHFEGFLPHKSGGRARRLSELAAGTTPVVIFESPYRLIKVMGEIEEQMGPRLVFVARELTKKFEEGCRGAPRDIIRAFEGRTVKGELVIIISNELCGSD
ncbi:MAG: 16S rRNA (cytidine(1402)-2'-O)-methyltransferase [Spartobacteria bacterium]|nr:16S rRNA (cytidine(1402)-2'-O)-methyltransferase [Spartobacteria bacterium]